MILDGKDVEAPFYNINGSNYIKLRDLAVILNVALDYFKSNIDKTENQLRFVMNTGHDFTDGSLNSNYFVSEFDTGIRLANVFSLHDNFANKNYDNAYKNYQILGLSGSKEEMIQFLNDKAKGRDIFHPKYTYRMAERRTFLTRGVTYTFDYGTDDQIVFDYLITDNASVLRVIPVKNPRIKNKNAILRCLPILAAFFYFIKFYYNKKSPLSIHLLKRD